MLADNGELIKKLKTVRDKYIAHDDIEKEEVSLTIEEISQLFTLVETIINKLSSKLNHESFVFKKDHVENDTQRIIEHLKRFEPYRLKEIEERYQALKTKSTK